MASTPVSTAASTGGDPFALAETEKTDEDDVADAARLLQQQIVYNGEVLDISFEAMRTYKEGTQSLAYLDASVYLAYALLRMMERWSKRKGGDNMYVRKKKKPKKKGQYGRDRAIAPMLICAHCGQGGRCLREKVCLTSKKKSLRTRRKKRWSTRRCSPSTSSSRCAVPSLLP